MRRAFLPLLGSITLVVCIAFGGCGTSGVGVDACRKIEAARCNASAACGATEAEVTHCNDVYRDQCLYGIQNANAEPSDQSAAACVSALSAVEACARAGTMSMDACGAAPLIATAIPTTAPCQIILRNPELLQACSFVAAPASADGGSPDTGSADDASDGDAPSD